VGENVKLQASDGHELGAYVAIPAGEPIAGLIVIQEAFGVNAHIRSVANGYARDGFLAIAPAMFDRIERGIELGYEGADREKGLAFARALNYSDAVKDVEAALEHLRKHGVKKCEVIGYCLGGTMAWLAATSLKVDAAVGYYGGQIARYGNESPGCPVMLHFGTLRSFGLQRGRSKSGAGAIVGVSEEKSRRMNPPSLPGLKLAKTQKLCISCTDYVQGFA